MTTAAAHRRRRARRGPRPARAAPAIQGSAFPWIATSVAIAALAWGYWPVIVGLVKEWRFNDDYSVGQLVPIAAAYLIWLERRRLREWRGPPCWWGLALIAVAELARGYGLVFMYESAERYALVFAICGLVLFLAGRKAFFELCWVLLFLFLMVPLPGRIHNLISGPLQGQATTGAVVMLEILGVSVAREGHVIVLNGSVPLAVAEACSGLRMLTAFVVVASTLAFIVKRPKWQKVVLVCSSIPIAISCNLVRLVATAVLYLKTSSETAERFFHDFAGLTMMPLAVLILLGELWIMARLEIDDPAPAAPSPTR